MALIKRGNIWWYSFRCGKRLIRHSAKTADMIIAKGREREHRLALRDAHAAEQHAKLIMAQFPIATIERWLAERRAAERTANRKR